MWLDIRGHDAVAERFRRTLARGRLASTYLFVGPSGIGKRSFALRLAQALLCHRSPKADLSPCGQCESCVLFVAGNHPDLLQVRKPAEKSSLPIELFIGKGEKRNQEGLCHDLSMRPMIGRRRVAVIDDADDFNEASANCLLKTLEEPPPRSVIVLIGTTLAKQLPTIRSRAQVVRFAPLSTDAVEEILRESLNVGDLASARQLAERSRGSIEDAIAAQDEDLWMFREELLKRLSAPRIDGVRLAKEVNDFVNGAGKEAPPRRARLRRVIAFAVELYRGYMLPLEGGDGRSEEFDQPLRQTLERLAEQAVPTQRAFQALESCLQAEQYLLRNANQATLIQWWLAELAVNVGSSGRGVRVPPI